MYNWALDSVGNWHKAARTPAGGSETTEVRQHNKLHQITTAGSTTLAYDHGNNTGDDAGRGNGNITDDGTRTFEYDVFNRVKTVTKKSGSLLLATYYYDGMGRRVRKIVTNNGLSGNITNGTTDYLYDDIQCVEERQSDSATKQYVWGLYVDELIQQRNIGTPNVDYYPLSDLLYRTTALTDSSGTITEAYDTDAYGQTIIYNEDGADNTWFTDDDATTDTPTCEFIFTSRRYDADSELYYYRARYYNPELGRFLSRDPLGYRDGMSLYEYVGSKPIGYVDPTGQWGAGRRRAAENRRKEAKEKRSSVRDRRWAPKFVDDYLNNRLKRKARELEREAREIDRGNTDIPRGHSDFPGGDKHDYNLEDDDPKTAPTLSGNPAGHFQPLEESIAQVERAIRDGDGEAFERAMHRMQDYDSHYRQGYRWDPANGKFGHAWEGTSPDNPELHPDEYQDAYDRTQKYLDKWNKEQDKWLERNAEPIFFDDFA